MSVSISMVKERGTDNRTIESVSRKSRLKVPDWERMTGNELGGPVEKHRMRSEPHRMRAAGWIGVFAYSYGLGHGLMHARDGWTGMASGVEVILLLVQILNLAIWTYLLVRSHGRSL